MDKIIRTSVEENNANIIKKQVMNKSDDNLIRHQVIGIGGEPITPTINSLSVTENGTYTVPEGVDGYNPVIVNVDTPTPTFYSPTYIKLQKYFNEPEIGHTPDVDHPLIITDWVYLESAGASIVPPYPDDNLNTKVVVSDIQDPTFETIENATIFYCFSSDSDPRSRGSYPNELTYSGSHNTQTPPTKIYSYDPSGSFEWTEIEPVQGDCENHVYSNYVNRVLYSSVHIIRNTVQSVVYYMIQNLIGEGGKISDPYKTDYFDVYYCSQGTLTNELNAVTTPAIVQYIGNMTLKGMYDLLSSGNFPPNVIEESEGE